MRDVGFLSDRLGLVEPGLTGATPNFATALVLRIVQEGVDVVFAVEPPSLPIEGLIGEAAVGRAVGFQTARAAHAVYRDFRDPQDLRGLDRRVELSVILLGGQAAVQP